jgi:hypothetical protein
LRATEPERGELGEARVGDQIGGRQRQRGSAPILAAELSDQRFLEPGRLPAALGEAERVDRPPARGGDRVLELELPDRASPAEPHPRLEGRVLPGGFGDASVAATEAPKKKSNDGPADTAVTIIEKPRPEYTAEGRSLKLEGDVVLEFNGQHVEGTTQFQRLVRETPVGRQAKISVWRNGAMQTLTATVGGVNSGPSRYCFVISTTSRKNSR